jgi:predicted RND superfamily exporter protein
MNRYAEWVIKWRIFIIIAIAGITVFFATGLGKLRVNSDITSYLKPDDEVMQLFNRIGDEYGGNHTVMVAVRAENIIRTEVLQFLSRLYTLYDEFEGISSITSLVNIIDIKETDFGLEIGKLIDRNDIPHDSEKLNNLRRYILSKDIYKGKIISEDGSTTIIICKLDPESNKVMLAHRIKQATEREKGHFSVFYSGYPVQMSELGSLLINDLKILIPIVIIVIVAVLYFSFRTVRGVLFPLLIVVISTIWTMGLMGYTNTKLSLISNVVPVVLLGVGTAYCIHFLSRFSEELFSENSRDEALKKTISEVGVPILLTGLTTVTGFISFTGAYITAITEFGLFSAFGVFVSMSLSISFLPAVLSLMKQEKNLRMGKQARLYTHITSVFAAFVRKRKNFIIIISMSIAVCSMLLIPRIRTETALTKFFPESSEIRKADSVIRKHFGGSVPVYIVVKGNLKDPQVLKKIRELEKYLSHLPYMSNAQSISDLIGRMNDILNGHDTIPDSPDEVANLLFLLEGDEFLEQLINHDYTEGIVHARFGTEETATVKNTVKNIHRYLESEFNAPYAMVHRAGFDLEHDKGPSPELLDRVSRMIVYDFVEHTGSTPPDLSLIRDSLTHTIDAENSLISEDTKKSLIERLELFFKEESLVSMEKDSDIRSVSKALVDFADEHTVVVEELTGLLRKAIPAKYYDDDPETLMLTAEFILPKIQNAQKQTYVLRKTEFLMKMVFPGYAGDAELRKKFSDDIWLLTEENIAVAARISSGSTAIPVKDFAHAQASGMLSIINRLTVSLERSQVQSILIAAAVVFLFLAVQFRSMKMGLVVLSPILLIMLINFGIMGLFNIPLDYATMLAGSILIGIGIDYAIHFSSRYRAEMRKTGNAQLSIEKTLMTTGSAILTNALTVALGFFVLVCGNFVPVKREGWMIGMLMILSACAALIFLPSLLLLLGRYLGFERKEKLSRRKT